MSWHILPAFSLVTNPCGVCGLRWNKSDMIFIIWWQSKMKHLMFHLLLPGNQYPLHALCLVFKSRKSICDKVLSGTNCFTFEFASSRKMRHRMCSEKLSGWRRTIMLLYVKECPHLKPRDNFCNKKTWREIPIFKTFLYLPVQFILHSQKLLWSQSGCQMLLLTQVGRASESSSSVSELSPKDQYQN